ncbi:MAG: ATP-binding protein [Clostridium sp.]
MLKKIQRIIIFTVLLLTIMIIVSFICLMVIQKNAYIDTIYSIPEIEKQKPIIMQNLQNIEMGYYTVAIIFIIIATLVSSILSKCVLAPTLELIKSAQAVIAGESIVTKKLNQYSHKDEMDDLLELFLGMDSNLKENLTEATRQKKEIETILFHLKDGVISFDIHGNISHINNAAKTFLDIDENTNFFDVCKLLEVDFTMEKMIYLEKLASQNKVINIKNRTFKVFFAPLQTEEDKADGIVIVMQEITEHFELDKMRKRFVADVSHELKTPITSMRGYAETILQDVDDVNREIEKDQIIYFVRKMEKEAERMQELVSDLLILSKYDSNIEKRKKQYFQVTEIIKELEERFQQNAKEKNILLKSFITSDIPEIYADKFGVERVITNILTNAIKYTKNNGTVYIYVGFLYNNVYIKIKDTGIGIKEEDINKIFERFYRVDSSRVRASGGTGLGLSIAKEIVEKNNGTIDITSELDKGTVVVVRFPIK